MATTNGSKKRVALYIRVSTDEQAKKGYSVPDQLRELKGYAGREGYEVVEEVVDDGYSGATQHRPGLNRIVGLAESGAIDVVLATKRDRYWRSRLKRLLMDEDFKEYGVRLRALNDTGNRIGDGVQDDFAEWEREQITERTKRGKEGRARAGKIVPAGTTPLGFRYDKEAGTYAPDPEGATTVRRIFELVGRDGESLHQTKLALEAERRPMGQGGRFWSYATLKRVIQNDLYLSHTPEEVAAKVSEEVAATLAAGTTYGLSKYGTLYVPVIDLGIPREWVEAARRALGNGRKRDSRADDRFWPLQGHIFCVGCGRQLLPRAARKDKSGKRYHYYVCSRYATDGREACSEGRWHRAEPLETQIFWKVWELTQDPEKIAARIRAYVETEKAALKESGAHIRAARAALAEAELRREKYMEMASRDYITLDELGERLATLDAEKEEAQSTLTRYASADEEIRCLDALASGSLSLEAIAHVRAGRTDDELLRDLYRDLGLRIEIDRDGRAEITGSQEVPLVLITSTSPGFRKSPRSRNLEWTTRLSSR